MERLASSVRDFVSEHPRVGYHEIVARFGTPEQVAGAYLSELDSAELMDELSARNKIVRIAFVTALTMILMWVGVISFAYVRNQNQTNGYFTEQIVNVEVNQDIEVE